MKQLFTIFLTMVFCFCLSAEDKQNAKKNYIKSNAQALKSYTWYDGNTEKTAWMLTDVVAEFGNSSLVKSFDKSASVSASYGAVQIWKLGDLTQKESIARSNSGSFSPVYTNNSNGDGTKMALTGKIVVFLKPGVDGAKWASDNNLKIVQKNEFRKWYCSFIDCY